MTVHKYSREVPTHWIVVPPHYRRWRPEDFAHAGIALHLPAFPTEVRATEQALQMAEHPDYEGFMYVVRLRLPEVSVQVSHLSGTQIAVDWNTLVDSYPPVLAPDFWENPAYARLLKDQNFLYDLHLDQIPLDHWMPVLTTVERHDGQGFNFGAPVPEIELAIPFMTDFGRYSSGYSVAEIDLAVGRLFVSPYGLGDKLRKGNHEQFHAFLEAMFFMFRDGIGRFKNISEGDGICGAEDQQHYMLFDGMFYIHDGPDDCPVLRLYERVLSLEHHSCQYAALHGLNHHGNAPRRKEIISAWMAGRTFLDEEKELVEAYMNGDMM